MVLLLQKSATPGPQQSSYSMRFTAGRSQTMLSVTSGSRSSPPPTLPRAGSRSGGEPKHANGEPQRSLAASPSIEETSLSQVALVHLPLCLEHHAQGSEMHKTEMEVYGIKRTDEDDCKLSTVPELPEFSSPPSQTLKSNQDSEDYRNGSFTNSVSFPFSFFSSFFIYSFFATTS